jgi:predicted secreted protein
LSIIREIPEIRFQDKSQGSHDNVKEINIEPPSDSEILQLSTPSDIYKQMYKTEKSKAKEYRRSAIEAYLRAKDIKMRYIAKDIDMSDDSDDEP